MPFDKHGKHHMNPAHAKMSSDMPNLDKQAGPAPPVENDKGTGSTPAENLADLHAEMGGKHMHLHQGEDGSHKTHQVGEDGAVEGPHEHPDMEAAMEHARNFFADGHGTPELSAMMGKNGGGHHADMGRASEY